MTTSSADCGDEGRDGSSIVVRNPAMRDVYGVVDRIAAAGISALIVGETGVGKDLVATAIHAASDRRDRPFVRINCACLPEALFESELFGHEAGAFTGASRSKPGLLEMADGGTVFLDELGELQYPVQAKLLRAIEAREVVRIGGLRAQPIDVRFVSATNRDLPEQVARGAFRDDLYFRLSAVCINVPPLRERLDELEPLANRLLDGVRRQRGLPLVQRLSPPAMIALSAHSWPGNVRELRNVLELATLLCTGDTIEAQHLRLGAFPLPRERAPLTHGDRGRGPELHRAPVGESPSDRQRILDALAACNGNQTRAAARLAMPRRTLVAKLVRYAIPRPRAQVTKSAP